MNPGFLAGLVERPQAAWRLVNTRNGCVVACRPEAAFDSESRRRGLLGRDGLPADGALVIAPSNSVHTWFMRFGIDLVFVKQDGTVTKVRSSVGPWRLSASLSAFAVIELPAGAAARSDLRAGDVLTMTEVESGSAGT